MYIYRVCYFDGRYYCNACHSGQENVIPARVVHNWDMRAYPVCNAHKSFLESIFMHPLIDLRATNCKLYSYVESLNHLQQLRRELHFIQAYLFTCLQKTSITSDNCSLSHSISPTRLLYKARDVVTGIASTGSSPSDATGSSQNYFCCSSATGSSCENPPDVPIAGQELRQLLWPREYLYEHVHLYSLYDLRQIYYGRLLPLVQQATVKGKAHIMKCPLCSPRGFICELCSDQGIIYPFELETSFTCNKCSGVFHKPCIDRQPECPKCLRISLRNLKDKEPIVEES